MKGMRMLEVVGKFNLRAITTLFFLDKSNISITALGFSVIPTPSLSHCSIYWLKNELWPAVLDNSHINQMLNVSLAAGYLQNTKWRNVSYILIFLNLLFRVWQTAWISVAANLVWCFHVCFCVVFMPPHNLISAVQQCQRHLCQLNPSALSFFLISAYIYW